MSEITEKIGVSIKKLERMKESNAIVEIGQICNTLSIDSSYFARLVADAYSVMNEAEDEYKMKVSLEVETLTNSGLPASKAEKMAENKYQDEKKTWTSAKNVYKRYSLYLERIDRILDEFKQYCSSVKMIDLKRV
jgi:hypothetical protein